MSLSDYDYYKKAVAEYPKVLDAFMKDFGTDNGKTYQKLLTVTRIILRGEQIYGHSGLNIRRGPGAEGFNLEGTGLPNTTVYSDMSPNVQEYRIHRGPRGGALPATSYLLQPSQYWY